MKDLSGTKIKDYELLELIGVGGFGSVYRAYQPVIERDVAIKIILPDYANEAEFIRNFEVEARLVARLEHPHIVPLYDFWRDPTGAYIVMRYYRGGSVADSLRRDGPWDPEDVALMLDQIASALSVAHKKGVVHQDIKIANILLDEESNSYLTDFGIAKDVTSGRVVDASISQNTGDLHGSPEYMSPEQLLRTGSSDARSDIYSLGIVLFEMLTGKKPFEGESDSELVRKQLYTPIPHIYEIDPDLPDVLDAVVQRATDKTPRNRYQTPIVMAEHFRQALEQITKLKSGAAIAEPTDRKSVVLDDEMIRRLLEEPSNPYKGLQAFDEADADDFFGRDTLIERLYQRIRMDTIPGEANNFLAVVGPSGSGKSSVVKAGLLPRLRRHSADWFIISMKPGDTPFKNLENALLSVSQDETHAVDALLRSGKDGLHRALEVVLGDFISELVLVIDQFEELFTLVESLETRQAFIDTILDALYQEESRLRLVVTLRADFYDRPLAYNQLGELLRTRTEVVLPLTDEELEDAIVKPAQGAGLKIEPGLVEEIISDVSGEPTALPLLQYALTELFQRRKGITLTVASYKESGGVTGAMTRTADELYLPMSSDRKEITKQIFLRLVALGEGTEDTRRRTKLAELLSLSANRDVIQGILDRFGQRRLLVFDTDTTTRQPTVEITHETLIRNWQVLRTWLNENRDDLRLQRQLAMATREWLDAQRDLSFIARGVRLAQYEELLQKTAIVLSDEERQFLQASIKQRTFERRIRAAGLAGIFAFSIMMMILAIIAINERQRAVEAETTARSRELSIVALTNRNDLDLAALLSVEAMQTSDTIEARDTLVTILQSGRSNLGHLERYLHTAEFVSESSAFVRAVAISPDDRVIATGSQDGIVRLWDIETGLLLEEIVTQPDAINTLAFSPDGRWLASGGIELRVHNLTDDEELRLEGHSEDVWRVDFSPDGTLLASASQDGTVIVWDLEQSQTNLLEAHESGAYAVKFSPDGTILATGGSDNTIKLWDVATLEQRGEPLVGHNDWVRALAFNPSGAILASGDATGQIRLWSSAAGIAVGEPIQAHDDNVRDLEFIFDGRVIMSASPDGRVRLWNSGDRALIDQFTMPELSQIFTADADSQSEKLVVGSRTGAVIWDMTSSTRIGHLLRDFTLPVYAVGFTPIDDGSDSALFVVENDINTEDSVTVIQSRSVDDFSQNYSVTIPGSEGQLVTAVNGSPDGSLLAIGNGNRDLLLIDTTTGEIIQTIEDASDKAILSVAIAQDNSRMAIGLQDGEIILFDFVDGTWIKQDEELKGHSQRVYTLVFNDTGAFLASGGRDSAVWLWDLRGDAPEGHELIGHQEAVISLAFDDMQSRLVSGGRDNQIILWDVESGEVLESLGEHRGWVTSLDYSSIADALVSVSRDGRVILWDMSGTSVQMIGEPLLGHEGFINSVQFSQDGKRIISGGDDRAVILWDYDVSEWQALACGLANRNLTPDEWAQYMHDTVYQTTCNGEEGT